MGNIREKVLMVFLSPLLWSLFFGLALLLVERYVGESYSWIGNFGFLFCIGSTILIFLSEFKKSFIG